MRSTVSIVNVDREGEVTRSFRVWDFMEIRVFNERKACAWMM